MVAPIVFLLIFSGIEFARVNTLWHTASNAAYEGARRGMVPGATAQDIEYAATSILNTVAAKSTTVTVVPAVILPDTDQVTVDIDVPLDANAWVIPRFFKNRTVSTSCTLNRELIEMVIVP
jgi:Flp pilus assembly protein TadG